MYNYIAINVLINIGNNVIIQDKICISICLYHDIIIILN